jgi:hypothetical protein
MKIHESIQFWLSVIALSGAVAISYVLNDTIHVVITCVLLLLLISLTWHRKLAPLFFLLLPIMAAVYVFGSIFNLFKQFYYFDLFVHLVSAFVITLLAGQLLSTTKLRQLQKERILLVLLITSIGIAIGAVWEIFEWIASLFISHGLIRGPSDTALDLIIDSVGALVAGGLSLKLFYNQEK